MLPLENSERLVEDLAGVADALESIGLEEERPELSGLATNRDRLVRSIRSYLIPHLAGERRPLTVVFAGPTGSGKSTLVNSVSGVDFVETGPLRPTTRHPVVLASARDAGAFGEISGVACHVVVGAAPILADIAVVDTPDIDSTSIRNRAMAETLIDSADIVVFVTSALRYADLIPWEVLRRAVSRGAPVINVLNRMSADSTGAVTALRSMLVSEGLVSDVVRVPEHHIAPSTHRVPSMAVRELQRRVHSLVADIDATRQRVLERVMRSVTEETAALIDDIEAALAEAADDRRLRRLYFSDAARQLDLASLCAKMLPPHPPFGRLGRIVWRWRNRIGQEEWEALTRRITRRLVALVEGEVRRLGVGIGAERTEQASVFEETRALIARSGESWLEEIQEVAASGPTGGRGLAALALADAAARGSATDAFDAALGDPSIIPAVRASLISRLENGFTLVEDGLAAYPLPFDPAEVERLRQATSSLATRSQFADV